MSIDPKLKKAKIARCLRALLEPDLEQAMRFLEHFKNDDGCALVAAYAESEEAKKKKLPPIQQRLKVNPKAMQTLENLNRRGYGIFAAVNRTDGETRKKADITGVNAVWVDLDSLDRDNKSVVQNMPAKPDLVVATSKGKYHCYWFVDDCSLEEFDRIMPQLAEQFGGDTNAIDRSRVLRVAGFIHRKARPFLSHIKEVV